MRVELYTSGRAWPSAGGIGIYGCVEKVDGKVVWTESGCSGRVQQTLLSAKFAAAVVGLRKLRDEHVAHPEAALALYLDSRETVMMLTERWTVSQNEPHSLVWREARELFIPLDAHKLYFNWINANLAAELVTQTMRRHGIAEGRLR